MPAVKPKRRAAKLVARNPRRAARVGRGGAKLAARSPRATARGAGLLGLSARGRRRPSRARAVATAALAAVGVYFLDPQNGKRRRSYATDKAGKAMRRGKGQTESTARHAQGVAAGTAAQASSTTDRAPAEERLNDPALARKVESEIFRDADSSTRGAVSVNVENGVAYLRGQLDDQAKISALVGQAEKVEGIRQVENLLHTPGAPAPAKSDGGPGSGSA